ncbi:hypothetical protein AMTR_s00068p00130120 [Amborella trichopoda]|uniref:Uncharacterized protein n=1 Tax=Amborella trichopoda TaxID=13333 RepID=U5DD36_AMBTC|nr:hypothetical protein AMTR_s00068p00130120 [Amborella trichopoda]
MHLVLAGNSLANETGAHIDMSNRTSKCGRVRTDKSDVSIDHSYRVLIGRGSENSTTKAAYQLVYGDIANVGDTIQSSFKL